MANTIRQSLFISHKPEVVWEYLTTAELLSQWLMPNDFKPVIGHEFSFTTKPMPALHMDGVFHCKVLGIVPFKKLSYSWKGGPGNGDITLDTLVEWTLVEKNNGTELEVVHSGFDEVVNLDLYTGMTDGWRKKLQNIADKINLVNNGSTNA